MSRTPQENLGRLLGGSSPSKQELIERLLDNGYDLSSLTGNVTRQRVINKSGNIPVTSGGGLTTLTDLQTVPVKYLGLPWRVTLDLPLIDCSAAASLFVEIYLASPITKRLRTQWFTVGVGEWVGHRASVALPMPPYVDLVVGTEYTFVPRVQVTAGTATVNTSFENGITGTSVPELSVDYD